jgi:heme/copper-type cytochrome/quinol oxidase subunit 3
MTATTTPVAALPAAGGERPRNLLATGTAFAGAGATTFFLALLAAYYELRSDAARWGPPKGVKIDEYLGNMLVITMLLGAVTAQWAVSAVKRNEKRQATAALGLTIAFGLAFLNLLSYSAARQHIHPTSSAYGVVVAALVSALGLVVIVAVGFCLFTLFRVAGSQVTAAEPDQARAAMWMWHYATVASIVVWYTVVVLK